MGRAVGRRMRRDHLGGGSGARWVVGSALAEEVAAG
jgi:hypothetical protein